ncbi:formylglycine-generating enzyme family protein [Neisseria animalis]|uniref:Formylglycine-generating enzyme family protein n=1 Tax=Neisseria animalis TaxID=492 RepID=A0A5P3MPE6_NEIAN|nr:formylglycine-generating enzyme family protein [Neisseria animalis]QEY23403.1 formylglycine-generating enzyme family protein [Neisseria animalis]ROW33249.1 formylglycine-generating enzyme family protein [Neisseria animalis]VEE08856.1 Serine/threonine-protein kinase pkn1 [Neisseria animalis]
MKTLAKILVLSSALIGSGAAASDMVKVDGGSYRPLYLKKETPMISVKPYQIDKYPVTNAEFAEFVNKHPQWKKGKVGSKQAEASYLKHWIQNGSNSFAPKPSDRKHPVTNVSWFAANAYCTAQGKRLPTIDEWEFAAQASATQINGTAEEGFNRTILDWYADGGRSGLRNIGQNKPNYWGIYDMHGMIWEWTEDFNSSQLNSSNADSQMFCSGASVGASDPTNYAAFMRFGIRTSLQAKYSLKNLGFRCVAK